MEEWKSFKLIQLAEYLNGYAFKPDDWGREGLPIIRIEQLKNQDAKSDFCSIELPSKNVINNGDLIFSWSASLVLKIWDRGKAALNQHLFKVVPKENVDKVFLKDLIEFNLEGLLKSAHGSTMLHITRKELEKYIVRIPSNKPEQIRIAEILSAADAAIAETEALIAKYQRIKTGLMQDLLTRGIDEHGNIRSEETHRFVVKKGVRVPEEWEVVEMENLKDSQSDICYGIVQVGKNFHGGVPTIAIKDMLGDFQDKSIHITHPLIEEKYKRSRIKPGDLLISVKGTTGRIEVVPRNFHGNISRDIAKISLRNDCESMFYNYYFKSPSGQRLLDSITVGTTRKEVSIAPLKKLLIVHPSLDEQIKISTSITSSIVAINSLIVNRNKLHSIKAGLMQDLLSGRVRV